MFGRLQVSTPAMIRFGQMTEDELFVTAEAAAGGVRIEKHTTSDGLDMNAVYSKRADGTWLIRSRGTSSGKPMHFGMVCTADGQKCVRWDADGAKAARKSVKAAAAKLWDVSQRLAGVEFAAA